MNRAPWLLVGGRNTKGHEVIINLRDPHAAAPKAICASKLLTFIHLAFGAWPVIRPQAAARMASSWTATITLILVSRNPLVVLPTRLVPQTGCVGN